MTPNTDRNTPADVRFAFAGTGHVITRLFVKCGHARLQAGGVFKRGIPWLCAGCAKAGGK